MGVESWILQHQHFCRGTAGRKMTLMWILLFSSLGLLLGEVDGRHSWGYFFQTFHPPNQESSVKVPAEKKLLPRQQVYSSAKRKPWWSSYNAEGVKDHCTGSYGDENCCTPANPCGLGEGDCDKDADCKSGLTCRQDLDNCKFFNPNARPNSECCVRPTDHCTGFYGKENCCTPANPCGLGEGDCDKDADCKSGL